MDPLNHFANTRGIYSGMDGFCWINRIEEWAFVPNSKENPDFDFQNLRQKHESDACIEIVLRDDGKLFERNIIKQDFIEEKRKKKERKVKGVVVREKKIVVKDQEKKGEKRKKKKTRDKELEVFKS